MNNTFILNAIMTLCGIDETRHKEMYAILADYNAIQPLDTSNVDWLKNNMPDDLDAKCFEQLLNIIVDCVGIDDIDKLHSNLEPLFKSKQVKQYIF